MRIGGNYVRKKPLVISAGILRWWKIAAASSREPGGRRTRYLKKFIFRRPKAKVPARADAETEAKKFCGLQQPKSESPARPAVGTANESSTLTSGHKLEKK